MADELYCCGKNRHTKFCPECGKSITSGPLSGLVVHLLTTVEQKRKFVEKVKKFAAKEDRSEESRKWQKKRLANGEKGLAKYQAWADELQRLIGRSSTEAS